MLQIIFATGNQGKMKEIRAILGDMEAEILSMKEAGLDLEIEENGVTFEENAQIKARAVAEALAAGKQAQGTQTQGATKEQEAKTQEAAKAQKTQAQDYIVMADDSGLEIDCLNGEPGVYSARYLGEETPFEVKSRDFLRRLSDVPEEKRGARFVCAIAAIFPDGSAVTTSGVVEGRIGHELRGDNGFGYDPIFYLPEYGRTAAELSDEEKNRISHRSRALELMREELKKRVF